MKLSLHQGQKAYSTLNQAAKLIIIKYHMRHPELTVKEHLLTGTGTEPKINLTDGT